jgi:RNA polymerase sigma factor (sigma-70 family)
MADKPVFLSDLQLTRMALKDPRSEEIVLRRVYPRIYQIVRFAVGSRRQMDDIAQVAAMEVVKSLNRYGGIGSLEAWAGRIAYRTACRFMKRQRKPAMTLMPLQDRDVPNNETPEKSMARRQLFEAFLSKMDDIPEKRRVPLLLHLAFGYTVNEVSELTQTPTNTVKDRLKVAFRELQAILDEHQNLWAAMLEELP